MIATAGKHLPAGTRVRVSQPGPVPSWSAWDDDGQRTSSSVKRRLQRLFFAGDRKIHAEVVFIPNESERGRLRSLGRVKVQVRDPAGSSIVVTADASGLRVA